MSANKDALVIIGGAAKALGNGKVGGYLVRFSTDADPDLTGDFFTKSTDFVIDLPANSPAYYAHGLDPEMKTRKLAQVEMKMDDVGVWVEGQLALRDKYEKAIYKMVEDEKLGWSSSTAPNLVERKQVGDAFEITHWPLGLDASLTPIPAEPRNSAFALKSLMLPELKAVVTASYDPFDGIEESMTISALNRLSDALMYRCVYDCLYDDDTPLSDRIKTLIACFDQYRDKAVAVIEAIMSGHAAAEEAASAMKSIKSIWGTRRPTAADRSSIKTEREFETWLRDSGWSRPDAVAITSRGYKAILQRDAGSDPAEDTTPANAPNAEAKSLADTAALRLIERNLDLTAMVGASIQ